MTSDSDDLERQFRQSLKRLEAELARSNGIAAEKQNDEQLRQNLKRLEAELAGGGRDNSRETERSDSLPLWAGSLLDLFHRGWGLSGMGPSCRNR